MNPITEGVRIRLGMDLFAKGFSSKELNEAYYRLSADREDENLLMETATLDEMDAEYNPGTEMILEAITVRAFARTDRTMAALCRVLNKHLGEDGIEAQEAIVGKVKKSGLFAHVTVQIPFSDGQVLSIVFHSPDNDNRKITAEDEIIAFRWLLNKRDITHVVSPEAGAEVSLEQISKRVSQLVAKNSDRFQKRSAMVKEQKAALEMVQTDYKAAEAKRDSLTTEMAAAEEDVDDLGFEITNLSERLAKAKELNASLQAQIDALKKQRAANEEDGIRKEAQELGIEKGTVDTLLAEGPEKLKEVMQMQREKRERDAKVEERNRLMKIGQEQVAGIRLGDAEDAGKLWEQKERGELSQEEWDKWVEDLYATGRAVRPEPEPLTPEKLVAMPRADYEAQFKNINDSLYAHRIRGLLEDDAGAKTPESLMKEFLRLYGMAHEDAKSFLRIGLGYALRELPGFKDSDTLKMVSDKVTNNYLEIEDLIQAIAEGEEPEVTPEPEPIPPPPETEEPEAVKMLNRILNGDLDDDPDAIDQALDRAAEELEEAGRLEEFDDLLNEAADYYTVILERMEAA